LLSKKEGVNSFEVCNKVYFSGTQKGKRGTLASVEKRNPCQELEGGKVSFLPESALVMVGTRGKRADKIKGRLR